MFLSAQVLSGGRELVDAPAAPIDLGPAAGNQSGVLKTMEGRIERPFRQVDERMAPGAERLGDRIAVSRGVGHNRKKKQFEVTFEDLSIHASLCYT